MRILYFIDGLGPGGKERRLVELIRELSKDSQFQLELAVRKKDIHYKDIHTCNIKIHFIERKGLKKDPRVFYAFYKIAKKFKPDIIHVWSNLVAVYAIPTKTILKIPMVNNQVTNSTIQRVSSILNHRLTFPFSDRIIANTYAGLEAYNAPKPKSRVIYNGFDFKRIRNLEDAALMRNKLQITTKYIVGMVASFTDKKDYTTYINAANCVLENENEITFLCVGSGDSSNFEKEIPTKNKNKILFLGSREDVESIMQLCDIGVLTTNQERHGEGISNAILEFSALGKPVVATSGGGTLEIIEDHVNGFLINPKSPEALAEKILFLIKNEEFRTEMGARAKEIVVRKFSISKMIDDFKNQYHEVLNKQLN